MISAAALKKSLGVTEGFYPLFDDWYEQCELAKPPRRQR